MTIKQLLHVPEDDIVHGHILALGDDGRIFVRYYTETTEWSELAGPTPEPRFNSDIYWQLLRALEERCGSKAGALDKDLIKQAYAHFNKVMGTNHTPSY